MVLHSLFEEQITLESQSLDKASPPDGELRRVALLLPGPDRVQPRPGRLPGADRKGQAGGEHPDHRQPERRLARAAGSSTPRRWSRPGADALELNIYYLANDPKLTSRAGGGDVRQPGGPREGQRADSGRREAGPVFQRHGQHGRRSWTRPARTGWCCSTASTSRISTWKPWT